MTNSPKSKPARSNQKSASWIIRRLWSEHVQGYWPQLLLAFLLLSLLAATSGAYPLIIKYSFETLSTGRYDVPLVGDGRHRCGDEPQRRHRLSAVGADEPDQHQYGPGHAEAAVWAYSARRFRAAAAGAARPASVAYRQRSWRDPGRYHGRVHDGDQRCADRYRPGGLDVLSRLDDVARRGGVLSAGRAADIEHRQDNPQERIPDRTADRQLDLGSCRASFVAASDQDVPAGELCHLEDERRVR